MLVRVQGNTENEWFSAQKWQILSVMKNRIYKSVFENNEHLFIPTHSLNLFPPNFLPRYQIPADSNFSKNFYNIKGLITEILAFLEYSKFYETIPAEEPSTSYFSIFSSVPTKRLFSDFTPLVNKFVDNFTKFTKSCYGNINTDNTLEVLKTEISNIIKLLTKLEFSSDVIGSFVKAYKNLGVLKVVSEMNGFICNLKTGTCRYYVCSLDENDSKFYPKELSKLDEDSIKIIKTMANCL